jgi:hypothetical protein
MNPLSYNDLLNEIKLLNNYDVYTCNISNGVAIPVIYRINNNKKTIFIIGGQHMPIEPAQPVCIIEYLKKYTLKNVNIIAIPVLDVRGIQKRPKENYYRPKHRIVDGFEFNRGYGNPKKLPEEGLVENFIDYLRFGDVVIDAHESNWIFRSNHEVICNFNVINKKYTDIMKSLGLNVVNSKGFTRRIHPPNGTLIKYANKKWLCGITIELKMNGLFGNSVSFNKRVKLGTDILHKVIKSVM